METESLHHLNFVDHVQLQSNKLASNVNVEEMLIVLIHSVMYANRQYMWTTDLECDWDWNMIDWTPQHFHKLAFLMLCSVSGPPIAQAAMVGRPRAL